MTIEDWSKKELEKLYINLFILEEETDIRKKEEIKKQQIYIFIGLNLKGYRSIYTSRRNNRILDKGNIEYENKKNRRNIYDINDK